MTKRFDDGRERLLSHSDSKNRSSNLEWVESSWTRWLNLLFWCWMSPTLRTGYKQVLTDDDLDPLPNRDKSSFLLHRLESYDWTSASTCRIIIREFWREYISTAVCSVPYIFSRIVQPLLLRQVVLSLTNKQPALVTTNFYLILLCLFLTAQYVLDHQIYFSSYRMALRIRNTLMLIIYRRSLSITLVMWQKINMGQMVNLIVNDTAKVEEMFSHIHAVFGGIIETIIVFILLCWIIGSIPACATFIVFVLSIICSLLIGRYVSQYDDLKTFYNNQRVRAFYEMIHGCYTIKVYNWEKSMEDRIGQIRKKELSVLRRIHILTALNSIFMFILVPLLGLTTFSVYWLLGYPLNAVDCFTVLALFGLLRGQFMFAMPVLTERLTGILGASRRIDEFMRSTSPNQIYSIPSHDDSQKGCISMLNTSFVWTDTQPCLVSLNINIKSGSFIGIVGAVGAGKSSLLAAILGEMTLTDGQLITHGSSFSYASQSPWIFADTIRNNIILDQPFKPQCYRNILHACCLDVDLNSIGVAGDLTMIGERGINLSGGQKARVSLARALYRKADVYLVDDPLASVDGEVARQIYERCFSSTGLLKNKTCLLVTHQTQFLANANQIIFLTQGHIDEQVHSNEFLRAQNRTTKCEMSELENLISESTSMVDPQPIITKEASVHGQTNWSLWFHLLISSPLGMCGLSSLIFLTIICEIFYDGSNYWLRVWSKQSPTEQQSHPAFAHTYFGLVVSTIGSDVLRTILFFFIFLHGANNLHNSMLKGLLNTTIQFFESNASGRILCRASSDQKVVDETLPPVLLFATKSASMFVGSVVVICLVRPYVLLVIVALIPFFIFLCHFYLRSKNQLKQLESTTSSPVYDLLSTSLYGSVSLRAFKIEEHFISSFIDRLDRKARVSINTRGATRWFGMRLNLLPLISIFATAILLVAFHDRIDPSVIIFVLSYAISMPKSFQLAIQQLLECDLLMASVERIYQYSQVPPEEDQGGHQSLVNIEPDWPTHGEIDFRNYSLSHRKDLDPVLTNINIKIKSAEKVGIIGRTGAGKSSLFKGIFRFIHRSHIQGTILIDNIDISRITLQKLRSHLSIIPQHPILFSGTLRYNLDPFNRYSDEQCWIALDDVQLKQFVSDHPMGLEMLTTESGGNISAGQAQLICIARAILKQSKILLIDEATSNVDQQIDSIIQTTMAEKFRDRTVLTIAHRLDTVAKSDRILVLDKGSVVNFDIPTNILPQYQNPS
ncbi:unnamed protein product [Adineta ricciae]|uniref:Uncharacterized protein n=1 Tax=Adineta ricciae TaxID=249248 RepID=A0A814Q8I7_ADIRI|nr:unnamed protein product [Adineta ricciae]CAF1454825.1 unnamed protein product [Adineta ricciae]